MKFGIHVGHMAGPLGELRRLWNLRGTVGTAREMVDQFRVLGCTRLNIAYREGPYDWDALEAFATDVVRGG